MLPALVATKSLSVWVAITHGRLALETFGVDQQLLADRKTGHTLDRAVMAVLASLLLLASTCCLAVLLRFAFLLVHSKKALHRSRRRDNEPCHVAVFLGSGGHTTEMLQMLEALPRERYWPRTYIVSRGDQFSLAKAQEAAQGHDKEASTAIDTIELPRARRVHQTWLSTPLSTLLAFAYCVRYMFFPAHKTPTHQINDATEPQPRDRAFADVILMNGPGTCVPIVAAIWLARLLGRDSPRLVYIESFARVKSLSLTAKIVRHFVDAFVVQWPDALVKGAQYRGWLV